MSIEKVQALAVTLGAVRGQNWRIPDEVLMGLTDAEDICSAVKRYGRTQGQTWVLPMGDVDALVAPKPKPAPAPKKVPAKKKETDDDQD